MLKNKKGFTLVELLAVIVILAIILAIAVPSITSVTNNARKDSLSASIKLIIKGIQYAVLQGSTVTTGSAISPAPYGASANDITSIVITQTTDPITLGAIVINGTGKFANCTVASGSTYTAVGTIAGSGCS